MRKVFFKIFGVLLSLILVLVGTLSLAGAGLVLITNLIPSFDGISFAYALIGEILIPIEFIINEGLGDFYMSTMKTLVMIVGVVFAIICFICVHQFRKIEKKNKKTGRYKQSFVKIMLCSLFLIAYGLVSLHYTFTQFKVIERYYRKSVSGMVKTLTDQIGIDALLYKAIGVCAAIVVFAFFVFVFNFFNIKREKGKGTKVKKQAVAINFYSQEFMRPVQEEVSVQEQTSESLEQGLASIRNQKSEELVAKIMQLNKLRDSGQISITEYTRLRQKLIRRYR